VHQGDETDAVNAGNLIIVVTGVLVAIVHRRALKPLPQVDWEALAIGTHDIPTDHSGTGSFDGDVGH
jgi:hypothetical protein